MTRERIVFSTLTALALFILFARPEVGWNIADFLGASDVSPDAADVLRVENAALKGELAVLKSVQSQLPKEIASYVVSPVFARYPFQLKDELTVKVGAGGGVSAGDPVFFYSGEGSNEESAPMVKGAGEALMLIGRVQNVFSETALVQTIFDARWRSVVRVGVGGAEALLVGGLEPRLTLIAKDAVVAPGDAVFSADETLPFGVPVGTVRALSGAQDTLLQEAVLHVPYDTKKIRAVLIQHYAGTK